MLLSGNEESRVARRRTGARVAAGYPSAEHRNPGDNRPTLRDHLCRVGSERRWRSGKSPSRTAFGGAQALATIEARRRRVTSRTLLTAAYTGVNAGAVIVSADDPGMQSSQSEQDNRHLRALC